MRCGLSDRPRTGAARKRLALTGSCYLWSLSRGLPFWDGGLKARRAAIGGVDVANVPARPVVSPPGTSSSWRTP